MKKKRTIISFDLDGVLFVNPDKIETEPPLSPFLMHFYPDHLRKGTVQLIRDLQKENFAIWVYTSSYRTELYIKALFWHYHIKFDHIINGYRHDKEVQQNKKNRLPSKLPNYYQISLHIDDEEVVVQNGRDYGFRVLRVNGPDPSWTERVLQEARLIRDAENKKNRRLLHR